MTTPERHRPCNAKYLRMYIWHELHLLQPPHPAKPVVRAPARDAGLQGNVNHGLPSMEAEILVQKAALDFRREPESVF